MLLIVVPKLPGECVDGRLNQSSHLAWLLSLPPSVDRAGHAPCAPTASRNFRLKTLPQSGPSALVENGTGIWRSI